VFHSGRSVLPMLGGITRPMDDPATTESERIADSASGDERRAAAAGGGMRRM
jgi:hypothetical protein